MNQGGGGELSRLLKMEACLSSSLKLADLMPLKACGKHYISFKHTPNQKFPTTWNYSKIYHRCIMYIIFIRYIQGPVQWGAPHPLHTKCVGKIFLPNVVVKFGVFHHKNHHKKRNAGFYEYPVSHKVLTC